MRPGPGYRVPKGSAIAACDGDHEERVGSGTGHRPGRGTRISDDKPTLTSMAFDSKDPVGSEYATHRGE